MPPVGRIGCRPAKVVSLIPLSPLSLHQMTGRLWPDVNQFIVETSGRQFYGLQVRLALGGLMRVLATIGLCAALGACAFPKHVERFGVEYNSALAGMSNEQTLLNILRARDGMPTHFTSVSQFRGNINLTGVASLNGQLRGEGLTQAIVSGFTNTSATTASTTTVVSAPGGSPSTTVLGSTVTTPVTSGSTTSTIAEGVDLFTPNVSGQIVSGTNFDVAVFDTQKFFQGITAAVPFSTIETLLHQGIDNRVLALLTIARVDFRVSEPNNRLGETILSVVNDPGNPAAAARFSAFAQCYELGSGLVAGETANLVAMSRVTKGGDGKAVPLPLDKVMLIDGEKFALSGDGIGSDPAGDDKIFLTRREKRVARLSRRSPGECQTAKDKLVDLQLDGGRKITVPVPTDPNDAPNPLYLGNNKVAVHADGGLRQIPVIMEVTFRSPEGMFRYLGAYLQYDKGTNITVDGEPLFSVADGRNRDALAQAHYRGRNYSLVNDPGTGIRNAQIFTLLQQLINLHKEATDRPTVIPVRAIP